MSGIITESGVSATTGEPFVIIRWDGPDPSGQMTPDQARELALTILGAAEAAITDAALMGWLTTTMGLGIPQAAAVMVDYRVARGRFDPVNTR